MKRRNFIVGALAVFFTKLWMSCQPSGHETDGVVSTQEVDRAPGSNLNCKVTNADNRGMFYRTDAPVNNAFSIQGKKTFKLRGTIYSEDCITQIPDAVIEIWQADEHGEYDMETNKYENRTILTSDQNGYYEIETFEPGHYSTRPKHIHFIVNDKNHEELVTQVYFKNDEKAIEMANAFKGQYDDRLLSIVEGKERFAEFDIYLKKS